ncbi:hypothetical protein [Roseiconus lacunae]|uniref:hypothetical protein n=1 Tax=Roseiconus lacunae TaxID=2605694 RepID=UPI00135A15B0|nr:hypothetical protein [Roseiconus lacunae]
MTVFAAGSQQIERAYQTHPVDERYLMLISFIEYYGCESSFFIRWPSVPVIAGNPVSQGAVAKAIRQMLGGNRG